VVITSAAVWFDAAVAVAAFVVDIPACVVETAALSAATVNT